MSNDIVRIVEKIVSLSMSSDDDHGYPHIVRVRRIAMAIASKYSDVDLEILELATLLHDIGRNRCVDNHAKCSAEIAREILSLLGYDSSKIERVVDAILAHSYTYGYRPRYIEGMILSDADKIDALGAIGIARVFLYSGKIGRGIEDAIRHIKEKILRLPDMMYTDEGRRIAFRRIEIVKRFIEEIENEIKQTDIF
ncbi:metal dependent phosphohydrolase [Ignisphaera aggregans DSM 17230]|uniref:Metal dependent phosphohydrolase n=1 Tax=Ignisphaera aggregans (strain DSM 17230 / JCM 13409 / AQ1.S1) TaxID=583356 RepID=E0SRX9_IGNAA|nr:metal dependent phosphohydrolase [Ignisphaera aggregans DSM 17230]